MRYIIFFCVFLFGSSVFAQCPNVWLSAPNVWIVQTPKQSIVVRKPSLPAASRRTIRQSVRVQTPPRIIVRPRPIWRIPGGSTCGPFGCR